MRYPQMIMKNKRKYELVEIHKHYAVYENENGLKECFKPCDLGMIRERAKTYDVSNHYTYFTKFC